MNLDKDNLDPITDLGLGVNYFNHCIQRRLNNHLGAGANAGSSIGMPFVTTDPLSELVWSPQKGPSLKCADCSFNDKRSSLLWGAGPSNVVFSSAPPSITAARSSSHKLMIEDNNNNNIKSQMEFYADNEVAGTHTLARCSANDAAISPVSGPSREQKTGTGGCIEETSTIVQLSLQHGNKSDDLTRHKGKGICDLNIIQSDEVAEEKEDNLKNFLDVLRPSVPRSETLFENPVGGHGYVDNENQTSKMEIILMSDIHAKNESEAYDDGLTSQYLPPKRQGTTSFMEEKNERKIKPTAFLNIRPMEKPESTAENDIQIHIDKNGGCVTSKRIASEFVCEGKRCPEQEGVFREEVAPGKFSATNSGFNIYKIKGKEKALSDGDVSMMSKEGDDSYESVESCNSTGLFSMGKKRWNLEQQMIGGSKRAKMQIQETLESTSFVKQDSSFVNWISNMMKGFLKSKEDEAPSISLTLAYPTRKRLDHDTISTTRNQNPGCRSVGFQSMFQSIYCPQRRIQDTSTSNKKCKKGLDLCNNTFDLDATPVNCHGENVNFNKQFIISNEKNTETTSGNGVILEAQPKISSVNFAASQENNTTNSTENKRLCNLQNSKEKEGSSSSSSLSKCKLNIAENIDSEPPSEGKAGRNIGNRSDHLGSLWIARLAPKTSGFSPNLNHQNVSKALDLECSTDCTKLPPFPQYHVSFPTKVKIMEARPQSIDDRKIAIGNELLKCASETECTTNCNRVKDHNDLILSSSRLKNSEAMVSLFARRLDALKHIMPSNVVGSTGSATLCCFFCGRKGHHLQDCSEITDADLEDILQTGNRYNGKEEPSCFCVKCFQFNHWAVTCPNASSKANFQREFGEFLAADSSPSHGKHNLRIEENPKFLNGSRSQFQAGVHSLPAGNDSGIGTGLKLNSTQKHEASRSGENKLKGSEIVPLCQYLSTESLDVPKGIFDAVRMLRLSRTDILKWMNLQMSGSHLDGCFLRLRVGKWEKGLGGTGYYVACITEAQRQSSPQNSKNSIFVVVRGIRCLVESQYISNHDFLEEELKAWWCATKKDGGTIPSEEVLRLKIKERRILGF